jgi:predicted metalloprotease
VRFRKDAQLDTSQVSDRRGARGIGLPVAGGGGIVGIIVLLLSLYLNSGGGGGAPTIGGISLGGSEGDLSGQCQTGEDANQREDCRIVGVVDSVQSYWSQHVSGYTSSKTVFFTAQTNTGCGFASSDVGPFYCPVDKTVYIDLGFYDELRTRFGATGGPFAEAYVIAHEYGHHIEDLKGLLEQSQTGATGPNSGSVRIELLADCFAGIWAKGAVDTGFIEDITDADIQDGLDAAAAVGDDRIQQSTQGEVNPESWTHGSSEQRQSHFLVGFRQGSVEACQSA